MRIEMKTLKALQNIYEYMEKDERKSFYEYLEDNNLSPSNESAKKHIFGDVVLLGMFIEECSDDYDSKIVKFM